MTPKQTAIVVAHILLENFLVHYGWPEKILTDQGKSFENNLFRELCSLAKVKKLCTSPYHPETNDQCECFNDTLISMLETLPSHAKKNWQEWITTLTHAYNCTVSPVTGFSPYFLMFGKESEASSRHRLRNTSNRTGTVDSTKLCSKIIFQVTMGIPKSSKK